MGQSSDNAHLSNERISLTNLRKGKGVVERFLMAVGGFVKEGKRREGKWRRDGKSTLMRWWGWWWCARWDGWFFVHASVLCDCSAFKLCRMYICFRVLLLFAVLYFCFFFALTLDEKIIITTYCYSSYIVFYNVDRIFRNTIDFFLEKMLRRVEQYIPLTRLPELLNDRLLIIEPTSLWRSVNGHPDYLYYFSSSTQHDSLNPHMKSRSKQLAYIIHLALASYYSGVHRTTSFARNRTEFSIM